MFLGDLFGDPVHFLLNDATENRILEQAHPQSSLELPFDSVKITNNPALEITKESERQFP